ncbi:hypothetical protein [Alienimonas chondri]|uniref:Uncharacterized protein n=1 Tax=Alienimonas chondri TaxID=2681879 RepID=A0ABX1VG87_9PLAN|nr:hypothetical protein [Alienimonas chondri]NNJ27132.1 hypothetical protein [Alienimonas chondri]
MPTLLTLACPKCAAPLPVPGGSGPGESGAGRAVRFLTCDHCNATVRLKRRRGTVTAKRVRRLGRRVEGLSRAVRRLRIEEKLHELDDRWNRRRATLIDGWDENGKPLSPNRGTAIFLTLVALSLIAWGLATSWLADRFPWSMALGGGALLLAFALPKWVQAERFHKGRERYRAERAALERRLSSEENADGRNEERIS